MNPPTPKFSRANPRSGKPNLNYLQNALYDLGIDPRKMGSGVYPPGVPASSGGVGKPSNAEEWFQKLEQKEGDEYDRRTRINELGKKEFNRDDIERFKGKTAKSYAEHLDAGFILGAEKGMNALAGLGVMAGLEKAKEMQKHHGRRAAILRAYMDSDPNAPTSGMTGERLSNVVAMAPELINPFSTKKYSTPLNAAYHAIMGYAPSQSAKDAAFSGGGHIAGEVIENMLTRGRGVPGQPTGMAIEKLLPDALDWFSQPAQAPSASYIPIRP